MKRRARNEDDKEDRQLAILIAASALFQEMPFQAITMAQVAERAGLAKGTLYLYFKTKEELFLTMLEDELEAWFDSFAGHLSRAEASLAPRELAGLMRRTLEGDRSVVRLLGILHGVLEQNASLERLLAFKRTLAERTLRAGAQLAGATTYLTAGQGSQLLVRANALAVGLYQTAMPSRALAAAMRQDPSLTLFEMDFAQELEDTLTALITGMGRQGDRHGHERVEGKNRTGHGRFERPWG